MKTYVLRFQALITASLLIATLVPAGSEAASGSETVSQTVTAGVLSLTTSPAATMSNATLNGSTSQTTTGNLGLTTVSDARGSGAGWALTASISNFNRIGVPVRVTGTTGSLAAAGSYTGSASGTYTITIINAGALGTATYAVSGLETQVASVTGGAVALGTRGLNLAFGSGNYAAGDQWTIDVSTIPANNASLTPSAASTTAGSTTGVVAGNNYTFSGTGDSATIMTATSGNGMGTYTNNPALSLSIPAGTKAGVYVATVTETLN